ncbi:hypothetical protein [Mesorhizobium captivum]|uniref:hypothetical protein n=1 Tax=Mesorhizobium captivum TaxID=3072319 RepID=UPI002A245E0B|nr:hypothetical protein [Mesorhizobium sp. VK3C]MDX8446910.1 hypothetical protein [Mesorhizobium sp. VK3C]
MHQNKDLKARRLIPLRRALAHFVRCSGMKMRGRFDGAMEQGFEAHLEQFQEKCERFSVRNCVKTKR